MKQRQNGWLYLFWIALAIELVAPLIHLPGIRYLSKPLLMVCLAGWYIVQASGGGLSAGRLVIAALFFSWLGDVFLLFESRIPLFFLTGLSSFLIAHLLYIFYFNRLRRRSSQPLRFAALLPITLYLVAFLLMLQPSLGALAWPVRIYAVTICVMLFTALQFPALRHRQPARKLLAGALLFVISDSLLALDKFHRHFEAAGFFIMLTYALAQYFIITGSARLHRVREEVTGMS